MEELASIFNGFRVSLWATASLSQAISAAQESYVVFCLPYTPSAVANLPDDSEMNRCKSALATTTKQIYQTITKAHAGIEWSFYDKMDFKYNLRSAGISQKVLAHIGGLGWIGRSSLLVTELYGAQVRIGTIFTESALPSTRSRHRGSCGTCQACISVCPARAITVSGYDVRACKTMVCDSTGEYLSFCGLCMQVCSKTIAHAAQQAHAADGEDAAADAERYAKGKNEQ